MRLIDLTMPIWEGAEYGEILPFTNSPVKFHEYMFYDRHGFRMTRMKLDGETGSPFMVPHQRMPFDRTPLQRDPTRRLPARRRSSSANRMGHKKKSVRTRHRLLQKNSQHPLRCGGTFSGKDGRNGQRYFHDGLRA